MAAICNLCSGEFRIFNFIIFFGTVRTKQLCDGANVSAASTCGRPLGITFNFLTGEMFVVDAKYGFLVVPPGGGLATQIATGFNGTTFGFPNALDIDQLCQRVYFTDAGAIFLSQLILLSNFIESICCRFYRI